MEPKFDHNNLLKKVAKDRLTPHGILQSGKSRTFLYDNGWWTILIGFESSSFTKGTRLNIGVDFNFYPRDYFAYEYEEKGKAFEEVGDEAQFEKLVHEYCDHAIEKVVKLKSRFKDVNSAITSSKKQHTNSGWDNYSLGILFGMAGQLKTSKSLLKKVFIEKSEHEWEFERHRLVKDILSWPNDQQVFIEKLKVLINNTRQLKKLPPTDLDDIQVSKSSNRSIRKILYQLTRI